MLHSPATALVNLELHSRIPAGRQIQGKLPAGCGLPARTIWTDGFDFQGVRRGLLYREVSALTCGSCNPRTLPVSTPNSDFKFVN